MYELQLLLQSQSNDSLFLPAIPICALVFISNQPGKSIWLVVVCQRGYFRYRNQENNSNNNNNEVVNVRGFSFGHDATSGRGLSQQ